MDCLDNMLTDPLELGSAAEVNGGGIMEECLLGGTRVSLPEDLLEDPDIFFEVVSRNTWEEVLSQSQRDRLRKLLPQFSENNLERQDSIITGLFNGENFHFGNPVCIAQKLFRDGYFNPAVVKYRKLCMKSQYKRYLYSQQQHFHKLLKQILISRKELLELARKSGPDMALKRKYQVISSQKEEERRVQSRYEKILREVKEECEDNSISSDEEEMCSWLPSSPTYPSNPSVALRAVPTLCTQDMKTVNKPELRDEELKIMLRKHVEKRRQQPDHPDLATGDLTLNDIITRMNAGRRGSLAALLDLSFPKKRVKDKEERKKKKLKVIKTEPEDLAESSGGEGSTAAPPEQVVITRPVSAPEQTLDATKPTAVPGITASFFSLLQEILLAEGEASVAGIEEKVLEWQISAPSTLNSWFSDASNWSELVHSALRFLSGEGGMSALPTNFAPYVNCTERGQQWKWIGSGRDSEKEITSLCQLWFEVKDQTFPKESEELADITPPTPRVRTDYVVRPSTGDEKRVFQEQERQRYSQPHKAFTFRMHGFDSVVGPVKGVFDKDPSLNKAREHSLLRSDRPAYVTILSLVRDAAARLPNGEGTRAEICELLKDSQFLAPEVTSAQINTVVSGALDRLHYEKDPCVKYDIGRKLWIYLHRNRSEEEFERIHQAQAAAAKAKKALQQKPKLTTKIKSSGKESGTKLPLSEQSLGCQVLADSSLPVTPITSVTPTLPITPTSPPVSTDGSKVQTTSAPELVKSGESVLLVSSPTMPQLGNLLSGTQPGQYTGPQTQARVLTQSVAAPLPQVRVVSAQQGLTSSSHQASVVQQVQQHQHQIRLPTVTATAHTKILPQSILTVPVKAQSGVSTVHIQQSSAKTNLTVAGINAASKTVSSSLNGTASSSASTIIQSVAGQSIMRQVAIAGQLGMKTQSSTGIPLTATNIQIQGKDVLRLAPSSITTDSKGQTVLRITQDMMATLTKAPVTTVKLTPDMLGGKGISATLHVTPAMPPDSMVKVSTSTISSTTPTVVKVTPDLKVTEASSTSIRLMPALAVTVADQKGKASAPLSSTDTKPTATIRIMPGLGVIPKSGQAIAVATSSKLFTAAGTVTSAAVTLATAGSKAITKVTPTSGLPISIGTGTTTVRQVPVSATMVSTTQATKLPATITVPLSVLNQPLKGKGVMAGQIIKGNLGANISGLGRNIILTTMPAGTKLIAGNKPVSFVTAQQLQQLQQQGQATQVRIQHLPTQQLHQGTVISSTKPISTVVVTTAASVNQPQDQ